MLQPAHCPYCGGGGYQASEQVTGSRLRSPCIGALSFFTRARQRRRSRAGRGVSTSAPGGRRQAAWGRLSERDRAVIQLVARFRQLSAAHLYTLLFTGSYTACNRTLRRLVADEYLLRIERRIVGGAHGGSGQYVYALGPAGHYTFWADRYRPERRVNFHALAIADCWVMVKALEKDGRVEISGASTEPDCWVKVGNTELKPDMYLELVAGSTRRHIWLEVDMATEAQRQVRGKLEACVRAYNDWQRDIFPLTIWACVDAARAREVAWLVSQLNGEAQTLFKVCTVETLADLLV